MPERIDVFRNRLIRFTQASALNDPFELRPLFRDLMTRGEAETQLAEAIREVVPDVAEEMYEKMDPRLRAFLTKEEFSQIAAEYITLDSTQPELQEAIQWALNEAGKIPDLMRPPLISRLTEEIGILSLTTDPLNMPMWAHYADQHRGFLIEFDPGHSWFQRRRSDTDEFFHLRSVVYRPPDSDRALVDLTSEDVLLRKDATWAYEQEWRMLAPVQFATRTVHDPRGHIYLFDVPPTAITGVVVGARAPQSVLINLTTALAAFPLSHITLRRAALDPQKPVVSIA